MLTPSINNRERLVASEMSKRFLCAVCKTPVEWWEYSVEADWSDGSVVAAVSVRCHGQEDRMVAPLTHWEMMIGRPELAETYFFAPRIAL